MDSIRLGMLTPSSNTVVEPVTQAIVAPLEGVTAHFSRFEVTEISLTDTALAQFEMSPFMSAAQLLADARMHVIAWNGTSAAWRGFHEDNLLCDAITERFATPATASMLVLNELLAATDSKRFALVTPYIDDVQSKIIANYEASGFHCVSERHLGIKVNFDFAAIKPDVIREMVLGLLQGDLKPSSSCVPISMRRHWCVRWKRRPAYRSTTQPQRWSGAHCG